MLEPPVSVEEFLAAREPELPENTRGVRAKPRASGIADCSRKQWYYMRDVNPTNEGNPDAGLTQEQGRMMEDVSIARLARTGKVLVLGRQVGTPPNYVVSGHPDGAHLSLTTNDGLQWGFEHKHYGRYEYERMLKLGLEQGNPEALSQILMYGDALGWDACFLVVVSQDASAVRGDMTINKRSKEESNVWVTGDMNPKVAFYTVDIREYKNSLIPMLKMRAEWLTKHRDDATPPRPEFRPYPVKGKNKQRDDKNGKIDFPCSYCPYRDRCVVDGPTGLEAPRLPFIKEIEEFEW